MFSSVTVCAALLILGVQHVRAADNRSDTWVPLDNVRDICGRDGRHSAGQYIFSPNFLEPQGATGWQCMKVGDADRRYNNESAWGVSWNWDDGSSTALHSFPNARLNNTLLPAQLSNVNTLWLYVVWTYATGNDTARGMDINRVANSDMAATVVLDVFIDSDPQKAGSPTEAKHELMIWLAAYGGVRPVGYKSTPVKKRTVGKVNFNLYQGTNEQGQQVSSWMVDTNVTTYFSDVSALVHTLASDSGNGFSMDDYMGFVRFGTQAYHTKTDTPVTFTAHVMKLEVINGTPKPLDAGAGRLRVGFGAVLVSVVVCFAAIFFG